jgi:hypothetical protein
MTEKYMAGVNEMGPAELRSRLLEFDRAVALRYPGQHFRLVLVGGGALVLLGYAQRTTLDLDVLAPPAKLHALMTEYDLSGQVAAYEDHFAYNLEDRLVPLDMPTVAVECLAASLEDLVASKLHSDRESDAADVRRPEVLAAMDWDRLAAVAEEMRDSSPNERRYRLFLDNYEKYRGECRPCGD